ncbi:hypothetical protein YA0089_28405 [Pseudomonas viridiflava]|uniref:hypothetical protein n=1 Tax=Pseudomonas viridiflava TaxID=33069 RepID=UPI0018E5BAD8|nr:hypothetical protein [Pseudomonas viridiflava]MBI6727541.1 hypothetical protein [Pseudomonas viridiflava]
MKSINDVVDLPSMAPVAKKSLLIAVVIAGVMTVLLSRFVELSADDLAACFFAIPIFMATLYFMKRGEMIELAAKNYALANLDKITECEVWVRLHGSMSCVVKLNGVKEWIQVESGPKSLDLRETLVGVLRKSPSPKDAS